VPQAQPGGSRAGRGSGERGGGQARASIGAPPIAPDPAVNPSAAGTDPLAPLHDQTLRNIAASGVVRTFPRNTILINEGDVGDALYVVLSGRVKVFASNEAGREFVIDFHGPGEYVGEMSLDGEPRSASVMTVEPTTCAVVNRAQLRDFILAHPDFAMHLIERLIHRVRVTTSNLKSLALSDVYGRLARLLNALAQGVDGRLVVPEKLTQQDIADRVGASRDMIGKLMKDLIGGGYLAVEDRTITILKKLPTGW
jgi:CRP/FNR family cyclic AMP-dependent transcriptional regulator